MEASKYQISIMEQLTRRITEYWVFFRPTKQESNVQYEKQGFKVIRGEFLISFK